MSLTLHQHEQIDTLERQMAVHPGRVVLETRHEFIGDFYIRTLFIPKGTLLTGEEHKTRHPWFLNFGQLEVAGVGMLYAPDWGITEPGTRRVARAWEDSEWATVHHNPTGTRDPEQIRKAIINVRHHLDGLAGEAQFKALLEGAKS